jgi:UDP-glucose 4-epimerase
MNWILGANGFVGSALSAYHESQKIPINKVSRSLIDFRDKNKVEQLVNNIANNDTIFFLVGEVPCRDILQLNQNILMLKNFLEVLSANFYGKFVYISSDAVYSDVETEIRETNSTNPSSVHGQMHLTREKIAMERFGDSLLIVRPSLIYGKADPHNSYGPNRFIRQALACQPINLIGEGEELRDHIHVSEVAKILSELVVNNFNGVFNLASGKLLSFRQVAEKVTQYFECKRLRVRIQFQERSTVGNSSPIRSISNSKIKNVLPSLRFLEMSEHWTKEFPKL